MRRLVALAACAVLLPAAFPADPPARMRVAVGKFALPKNLADEVDPKTLTDKLRRFGEGGLRYEAVAATGELKQVIEFYEAKRMLPAAKDLGLDEADFTRIKAGTRFLLLPTVSKIGAKWEMTATVIDLKSGEARTLEVSAAGRDTGPLTDLVKDLWRELDAPTLLATLPHGGAVLHQAFSPDGKLLATGSTDKTARVWDVTTGKDKELAKLEHGGLVRSVSFSPDGKLLATWSKSDPARLWDVATGKELAKLGHGGLVRSVSFSPDGKLLATGSEDKIARVWDARTGKELAKLQHGDTPRQMKSFDGLQLMALRMFETGALGEGDAHTFWSVAFSPDGKFLATARWVDETARVWDVATGKELAKLGHGGLVRSVSFSPDGKLLATGSLLATESTDKTARVWDVTTGKERVSLRHDGVVLGVSFSPDGKLLASGSTDKTARVWDVATGRELAKLKHGGSVWSVLFSPDGKLLASGATDHNARLWSVVP